MNQTRWAGGAKLTWKDVERIRARKRFSRDDAGDAAERLGVCKETVWRAYIGKSWQTVRFQRLPTEHKRCIMCGVRFERRFENGRHRSDTFWNQKITCGHSCLNRLRYVRTNMAKAQ